MIFSESDVSKIVANINKQRSKDIKWASRKWFLIGCVVTLVVTILLQ